MSNRAFIVCRGRVVHVANPADAGLQYQAHPVTLAPGAGIEPARHTCAETIVVVQQGTLEVMINGAESIIGNGSFARIPPGMWFTYRNIGMRAAELLVRTTPRSDVRGSISITFSLTAA